MHTVVFMDNWATQIPMQGWANFYYSPDLTNKKKIYENLTRNFKNTDQEDIVKIFLGETLFQSMNQIFVLSVYPNPGTGNFFLIELSFNFPNRDNIIQSFTLDQHLRLSGLAHGLSPQTEKSLSNIDLEDDEPDFDLWTNAGFLPRLQPDSSP